MPCTRVLNRRGSTIPLLTNALASKGRREPPHDLRQELRVRIVVIEAHAIHGLYGHVPTFTALERRRRIERRPGEISPRGILEVTLGFFSFAHALRRLPREHLGDSRLKTGHDRRCHAVGRPRISSAASSRASRERTRRSTHTRHRRSSTRARRCERRASSSGRGLA